MLFNHQRQLYSLGRKAKPSPTRIQAASPDPESLAPHHEDITLEFQTVLIFTPD
jgi:hypothetical protein